MRNPYQETLAERSLVAEPAEDGEYWNFRWYVEPITQGLSKWHSFCAHISLDGHIHMIGMWFAQDEQEALAQEQALRFVQERYERFGLDEKDSEGGN